VIDDRLADELEHIGVEGRQHLGRVRSLEPCRLASDCEIIGIARRIRPADDRNAGPGSSLAWIASQLGVTKKAAHERYGKISPRAWESRLQHTAEDCRLELSAI
jgi:hypothetical protein